MDTGFTDNPHAAVSTQHNVRAAAIQRFRQRSVFKAFLPLVNIAYCLSRRGKQTPPHQAETSSDSKQQPRDKHQQRQAVTPQPAETSSDSKQAETSSDSKQPAETSSDSKQPAETSSDSKQPAETSSGLKQEPSSDSKQQQRQAVTPSSQQETSSDSKQQQRQAVTPADSKQPAETSRTPSSQQRQAVTPSSQQRQAVTPSSQQRQAVTPSSQQRQAVTPSSQQRQAVTPSDKQHDSKQSKQAVTPSSQQRQAVTPSSQQRQAVTPSSQQRQAIPLRSPPARVQEAATHCPFAAGHDPSPDPPGLTCTHLEPTVKSSCQPRPAHGGSGHGYLGRSALIALHSRCKFLFVSILIWVSPFSYFSLFFVFIPCYNRSFISLLIPLLFSLLSFPHLPLQSNLFPCSFSHFLSYAPLILCYVILLLYFLFLLLLNLLSLLLLILSLPLFLLLPLSLLLSFHSSSSSFSPLPPFPLFTPSISVGPLPPPLLFLSSFPLPSRSVYPLPPLISLLVSFPAPLLPLFLLLSYLSSFPFHLSFPLFLLLSLLSSFPFHLLSFPLFPPLISLLLSFPPLSFHSSSSSHFSNFLSPSSSHFSPRFLSTSSPSPLPPPLISFPPPLLPLFLSFPFHLLLLSPSSSFSSPPPPRPFPQFSRSHGGRRRDTPSPGSSRRLLFQLPRDEGGGPAAGKRRTGHLRFPESRVEGRPPSAPPPSPVDAYAPRAQSTGTGGPVSTSRKTGLRPHQLERTLLRSSEPPKRPSSLAFSHPLPPFPPSTKRCVLDAPPPPPHPLPRGVLWPALSPPHPAESCVVAAPSLPPNPMRGVWVAAPTPPPAILREVCGGRPLPSLPLSNPTRVGRGPRVAGRYVTPGSVDRFVSKATRDLGFMCRRRADSTPLAARATAAI
ncbi:Adhesive plaque matrix protein [Penaeus vannamei]|uniref:Adhesive plaque matrix protein n=1 Tax=Penaeus vannamei TaxID=6689 RepID=A0A423TXB6_PENVA|nr:Adhesive plaque matrix protein [Penaeus vannamei]